MSEKYYSWSPYVYCGNNPVMLVDVNGKEWGIVMNANGTMTVTLAVNFNVNSSLNLTASQISAYKTAISTQLNSTFQEASGGMISASMSFDGGSDPNRLTPTVNLIGDGDRGVLGFMGSFYGDVAINISDASDITEFGETGVHELFHILNLQDLTFTPYINDTKMEKTAKGYVITSTTAKGIHKNIMNYDRIKIDGKSYRYIYKSRSGMNKITKGQLNFLLRSIRKQIQGYGVQFIQREDESEDEYKARLKEYWEDYWFDPENI